MIGHRFTSPSKLIILTAALFCLAINSFAERLPLKIYTSADGLGSSAMFNLVRDFRGFIWLCSRDGLIRFDGSGFITYRVGDENADPSVFELVATKSGEYWINLNRGTDYRFVPKSEDIIREPRARQNAPNDLRVPFEAEPLIDTSIPRFVDAEGNLWTANNLGLYHVHEVDGKFRSDLFPIPLPGNPTGKLTHLGFSESRGDGFWIGTNWGIVRRYGDGRMIHTSLAPGQTEDPVLYFAEDTSGLLWIARSDGLFVLRPAEADGSEHQNTAVEKGKVMSDGTTTLPTAPGTAVTFTFADILRRISDAERQRPNLDAPVINNVVAASDGKVWISTNRGLVVFDGKDFRHFTIAQGLATNALASMVEDDEGYIWIATYGGLHRLNPRGMTSYDETDGLERARIHSIYENKEGDLQVVSGNFNVSGQKTDGSFEMVRPKLGADELWQWQSNTAYLDSRGDWWFGTTKALYRFTGVQKLSDLNGRAPTDVFDKNNGLPGSNILRVFEDSNGDIWVSGHEPATGWTLNRWSRSTGQFQNFSVKDGLPESASLSGFAEDVSGVFWMGFHYGGIVRYVDGKFTPINDPALPTTSVSQIYRDRANRLWIATTQQGLTRVDNPESANPVFTRYSIENGLTSENIRCITEDADGNIYVGTVRGVNQLDPVTGRVRYFGTADGLASDFVNTAFRSRDGTLWFGTFNGLSKLVPLKDEPIRELPVYISGVRVAGEDYSVSPVGQSQVFLGEQAAGRNNVQVDYLSIGSAAERNIRYQYKFDGSDTDWTTPTTERSITFADLPPGAHRLLLRAVSVDDVVSANPAVVSFTILRPIWQRWWFLMIVALALAMAVYAFYRYRITQLLKLERVRTRIASDLHDDIGSSLSQIAILSEVARQKVGDNGASEPLSRIADTSREMVDSMSDIVWAINPQKDHLSDLIQRMRRFAEDTLDAKGVAYRFILPEDQKDIELGADVRREVYMIFKECINNLVKHSGADMAEIKIDLHKDKLVIEVRDDGRGFDTSIEDLAPVGDTFGGNGLPNMRRRAASLGGAFDLTSSPGHGTTVRLSIPVSKNRIKQNF